MEEDVFRRVKIARTHDGDERFRNDLRRHGAKRTTERGALWTCRGMGECLSTYVKDMEQTTEKWVVLNIHQYGMKDLRQ